MMLHLNLRKQQPFEYTIRIAIANNKLNQDSRIIFQELIQLQYLQLNQQNQQYKQLQNFQTMMLQKFLRNFYKKLFDNIQRLKK
ncbi:unnamed protein product [Paramecium octaurelia]|uniref:Uncharacterized protein n=1 Tax=Paramecium octaurelia TaxID=43137 RepID=A0A8S1Y5E4_PAROT|nr:unnamed protein product [Paramecium octaurelia]